MRQVVLVLALVIALPAVAQESASYKLVEHTFNSGGNPSDGIVLASASYKISLDAIGDSVVGARLTSTSFVMSGGFVGPYLPPSEVQDVRFIDKDWVSWDPARSASDYNLYRNGDCLWQGISAPPAPDPDIPFPGLQYFYLVTVENLLNEEGTTGFDSAGYERTNDNPCP